MSEVIAPERYAEAVILDPGMYDAVEVHPVEIMESYPEGDHVQVCGEAENADLWSVYVHCKAGGVECIGDFPTREMALEYATEIAAQYGYPITYAG